VWVCEEKMRILLLIAFILLIVALCVAIPSLMFIGIGKLVSFVFKITLFDSTILCAISAIVFYLIVCTILYIINTFMDKINIQDYIEENIKKEKKKINRTKIHVVE
jgi:membrane protein implicated in regulation of membrane protease activity